MEKKTGYDAAWMKAKASQAKQLVAIRKARLAAEAAELEHTHAAILQIAKELLGLETLETRNSDSLDFHELAVWRIKDALNAAFEAGKRTQK